MVIKLAFSKNLIDANSYFSTYKSEVLVDIDDGNVEFDKNNSAKGGALLKVNKLHDYFTSALPEPQKGADVTISSLFGDIPVVTRKDNSNRSTVPLTFNFAGQPNFVFEEGKGYNIGLKGNNPLLPGFKHAYATMSPTSYILDTHSRADHNLPREKLHKNKLYVTTGTDDFICP